MIAATVGENGEDGGAGEGTADPFAVPLRQVIAAHQLWADRRLGQNFLLDINLTARIARLAGDIGDGTVIEVGPGPGGLTRALLQAGARRLIAVEKDPRCVAALQALAAAGGGRLQLLAADALTLDIATLGEAPRRIVANLPFNVATPLLTGWLRRPDAFAGLTLMFQKEVAARIAAAPGTPGCSRLSVLRAFNWQAKTVLTVPARAFTPSPKVDAAVVSLTPLPAPRGQCALSALEKVTAAAFGRRRKMLRQALRSLSPDPEQWLRQAGIDPMERAERLTIEQFVRLTECFVEG